MVYVPIPQPYCSLPRHRTKAFMEALRCVSIFREVGFIADGDTLNQLFVDAVTVQFNFNTHQD
jgi:hypothetical protein